MPDASGCCFTKPVEGETSILPQEGAPPLFPVWGGTLLTGARDRTSCKKAASFHEGESQESESTERDGEGPLHEEQLSAQDLAIMRAPPEPSMLLEFPVTSRASPRQLKCGLRLNVMTQ